MSEDVVFWFDPICPYTWRTSRWLVSVTAPRNLTVGWRPMSLALLHDIAGDALRPTRVLVAVRDKHGAEAVGALYTELGTLVHEQHREFDDAVLGEALAAAGLPAELAAAAGDGSLDQAVRDSHAEGQDRVGTESGSPILALGDGPGFFGPVVVPVPTGEAAEKLFDAVRLLSAVPEFSELKRVRAPF